MQPKRPREDSANTTIREELLKAAQQIRLEDLEDQLVEIELDQALLEAAKKLDEQKKADQLEEIDLDQALLEAAKKLDEQWREQNKAEKAEKERHQRFHAQELLRTMSTADDLAGQWRAAVAYMKWYMHTG